MKLHWSKLWIFFLQPIPVSLTLLSVVFFVSRRHHLKPLPPKISPSSLPSYSNTTSIRLFFITKLAKFIVSQRVKLSWPPRCKKSCDRNNSFKASAQSRSGQSGLSALKKKERKERENERNATTEMLYTLSYLSMGRLF